MKKIDDPFSPENLTLSPEQLEAWRNGDQSCELTEQSREMFNRHRQKMERLFVKVPFLRGIRIAEKCHMPIMAVWLELLRASFNRHGQNPVRLSNAYLQLRRPSKARALRQLESVGEIRVARQRGKGPLVTILSLPLKEFDSTHRDAG